MFVSITRLRLRSWRFLVPFLRLSTASASQARNSAGYREGSVLIDRGLTFWTKTLWDSEQDMKAYRGSGSHGVAMPLLREWCSDSAVTHWTESGTQLPPWSEAHRRLVEAPRFSPVDHPGSDHSAHRIPEPKVSAWRDRRLS